MEVQCSDCPKQRPKEPASRVEEERLEESDWLEYAGRRGERRFACPVCRRLPHPSVEFYSMVDIRPDVRVPRALLEPLGQLAANATMAEQFVGDAIAAITRLSGREIDALLPGAGFKKRTEVLRALLELREPERARPSLDALAAVEEARKERNNLVHAHWGVDGERETVALSRSRRGNTTSQKVTPESLWSAADAIADAVRKLSATVAGLAREQPAG